MTRVNCNCGKADPLFLAVLSARFLQSKLKSEIPLDNRGEFLIALDSVQIDPLLVRDRSAVLKKWLSV
jgi:hypothetical protein